MGSAALHHNFEFIETNVNSLASAELQNLVTVESGGKKVYKKFAARMNQDVLQFQEDFGDLDTDTVFVTERRMAFMVEEATKMIYNITERLVNATGDDLPRRVEPRARERQGFATDAWLCPALTGRFPGM